MVLRFEFTVDKPFWIIRDYAKCSGCQRCEITCSLHHEGRIWPETSMVRVFMLVTGADVPHLCAQCEDHPFVDSCPVDVMSVNPEMKSIEVDREKYTACGNCITAYSGRVSHIQPVEGYALICDFCGGNPQYIRDCHDGR
jgi:Fe-S-cluster-containing hydrogenase component 2